MNKKVIIITLLSLSSWLMARDLMSKFRAKNKNRKIYVFVAEKISIKKFKNKIKKGFLMDQSFIAKYKIIKNIHNKIDSKIVNFKVYDHYGVPAFSKYRYVLLYLIKKDGKFYHSKYQYTPLYKTKDNRWASFYSSDYSHIYNCKTKIKPVKIDFKEDISFDISKYSERIIKKFYPTPYFKIKNKRAYPIYGNYIDELFQLKKDGVLKARGFF